MKNFKDLYRSSNSIVLIDQIVSSGSNFFVTLFLARFMQISNFAVYSTIVLVGFLLISFGNALVIQPFQVAAVKFKFARLYSSFLFYSQLGFVLLISVVSFIVYYFIKDPGFSFLSLALFIFGLLMQDYFRKFYLVKNQLLMALLCDSLFAFGQFISVFIIYNFSNFDLDTVLLLTGISALLSVAVSVAKLAPSIKRFFLWKKFYSYHFKEGFWLSLVSFIQWGSANLFIVSLGVFINIESLGAFRLIQSLFGVLNILFQTFENYVLPNASMIYNKSVELSKDYIRKTSIKSSILIGAVLFILFLFSEQLIFVAAGTKYIQYSYVVKGMCVLYLILFIGYPIRISIRMLLLNRVFFAGYLLSFIFSIFCFSFLLKTWQLNGVIIGLICNQLIMLLFWNYQLEKKGFKLWK
jgi:O-antigen/teichoic acid export membrane protein